MVDLPDRLSADRDSDYFDPAMARQVVVWLDGEPQHSCIEYCISEGWVYRICFKDGQPVQLGDELMKETAKGKVSVSFKGYN